MENDKTPTEPTDFNIGDKVQVTYGHTWDGLGVVDKIGFVFVYVYMIDGKQAGKSGAFRPRDLTLYASVRETAPKQQYIVEFNHNGGLFMRSYNDRTKGIFDTLAEATKAAATEQKEVNKYIGHRYTYRAAELNPAPAAPVEPRTCGVTVEEQVYAIRKLAKIVAVDLGRKLKLLTSDDVQESLKERGYTSKQLGNAAGNLFKFKAGLFKQTGRYVKSVRPEARGRRIAVWEYTGA